MYKLLPLLTNASTEAANNEQEGADSLEKIMEIFKNPIFYVVIGVIVILIILFYFARRFIKVASNTAIIVKKGDTTKVLLENNKRYFLKPFVEKIVVTIPLYEQEVESDQLFINDGPDKLYKLTYKMLFKITDAKNFFPLYDNFKKIFEDTINEQLRALTEEKNASFIIKEFTKNKDEIVNFLNGVFNENAIEILDMKIKAIEPIGVRIE